jgi:U32 family peptidase
VSLFPGVKMNGCELLAPAGSLDKLRTVIRYGADAVYLGGKEFSMRAQAANFSQSELYQGVVFAHSCNVQVFVTVNIFARNKDLAALPDYLLWLSEIGVDGLIISDAAILRLARKLVPAMSLHLSTQANVTNLESALFWQEQGLSRLNLARELTLPEIREIKEAVSAKIEIFVHGALCISYSGRCMLSLYLTGRDANQGLCAHPCRYNYRLLEEKRPGQFFPVEEDDRGAYIFNSKDLCLINRLPELISAGVDSIKIERRMKGIYYAGGIVRVYRAAIDHIRQSLAASPDSPITMPRIFMDEIAKLGTRGYTENFLDGAPKQSDMCYEGGRVDQTFVPAGVVIEPGAQPLVDVRSRIRPGDRLEYMGCGIDNHAFEVVSVATATDDMPLLQANPGSRVYLRTNPELLWESDSLIRRIGGQSRMALR